MDGHSRRYLVALLVPMLSAAMLLTTASAVSAAATCQYTASNHRVKVTGGDAKISRSIRDRILVNDVWCDGKATVFNTDSIVVLEGAGTQFVRFFFDYGGFKPGFTDEPGSSDEIEISVSLGGDSDGLSLWGGGTADHWTVGKSSGFAVRGKINLNADEVTGIDADLTIILGAEEIALVGRDGPDQISGAGGAGTGAAADFNLKIAGLDGADEVTGGDAGDNIVGGNGPDVLKGGPGPDLIDSTDGVSGNDQIFGGQGVDNCFFDAGDSVAGCT